MSVLDQNTNDWKDPVDKIQLKLCSYNCKENYYCDTGHDKCLSCRGTCRTDVSDDVMIRCKSFCALANVKSLSIATTLVSPTLLIKKEPNYDGNMFVMIVYLVIISACLICILITAAIFIHLMRKSKNKYVSFDGKALHKKVNEPTRHKPNGYYRCGSQFIPHKGSNCTVYNEHESAKLDTPASVSDYKTDQHPLLGSSELLQPTDSSSMHKAVQVYTVHKAATRSPDKSLTYPGEVNFMKRPIRRLFYNLFVCGEKASCPENHAEADTTSTRISDPGNETMSANVPQSSFTLCDENPVIPFSSHQCESSVGSNDAVSLITNSNERNQHLHSYSGAVSETVRPANNTCQPYVSGISGSDPEPLNDTTNIDTTSIKQYEMPETSKDNQEPYVASISSIDAPETAVKTPHESDVTSIEKIQNSEETFTCDDSMSGTKSFETTEPSLQLKQEHEPGASDRTGHISEEMENSDETRMSNPVASSTINNNKKILEPEDKQFIETPENYTEGASNFSPTISYNTQIDSNSVSTKCEQLPSLPEKAASQSGSHAASTELSHRKTSPSYKHTASMCSDQIYNTDPKILGEPIEFAQPDDIIVSRAVSYDNCKDATLLKEPGHNNFETEAANGFDSSSIASACIGEEGYHLMDNQELLVREANEAPYDRIELNSFDRGFDRVDGAVLAAASNCVSMPADLNNHSDDVIPPVHSSLNRDYDDESSNIAIHDHSIVGDLHLSLQSNDFSLPLVDPSEQLCIPCQPMSDCEEGHLPLLPVVPVAAAIPAALPALGRIPNQQAQYEDLGNDSLEGAVGGQVGNLDEPYFGGASRLQNQDNVRSLPDNVQLRSYDDDSGAGSVVDPYFEGKSGYHELHHGNNHIYEQLQNIPWVLGYHSAGRSISVYADLDLADADDLHDQLCEATHQAPDKFRIKSNRDYQ